MSGAGQGDAVPIEEERSPTEGEGALLDSLVLESERIARRRRFAYILILLPLTLWLLLRWDWIVGVAADGQLKDPMMTSGMLTVFVGLWLSLLVEGAFIRTMRRLRGDHIVGLDRLEAGRAQDHLERQAQRVQIIAGVGIGLVILIGYEVVERIAGFSFAAEFWISSTVLGAIVGARLGVMGVYGRLGSMFRSFGVRLLLVPGHSDEAGGSAPIGRFILLQGLLLAIVVVWLTAWLVLLSAGVQFRLDYSFWAGYFWLLWLIGAGFFYAGAIWPMLQFNGLMRDAKALIETHVGDSLRAEIEELHRKRVDASDPAAFLCLNKELGEAIQRRQEIEGLPSRPLSHLGQRLFSLGWTGPILAGLGNLVFTDGAAKTVYNLLIKWLSPLFGG